ncbi:unnamed protein product [Rotaria sp. Silwood2]|nr:unnamed protein product [Rotaria sp. Silwood2]CAF4035098.1 unnamed protein product [Rotaria sp. Silwood2]
MSQLLEKVFQVNVYLQPMQFCLSVIANTLNISVLSSRALRSSPCTHYFIAYAVFSIMYTFLVCPLNFARGFSTDWTNTPIGCKMHTYFVFLTPLLARIMLVLASFDRYCSSSRSHRLRSTSTVRRGRLFIVIGTILCIIYVLPMLTMYYSKEPFGPCLQYSNLLINIYVFSQIVLYYISSPLLMIIFGLLTISTTREHVARIGPQSNVVRGRRTEKQLNQMLLLQVSVHLVLTVPFGVIYSMNALDPSTRTPYNRAIRNILFMWQQCDYFVSFFLYVLSGSAYRKQLAHILKFIKHSNQSIHQSTNQRIRRTNTYPTVVNTLSVMTRK